MDNIFENLFPPKDSLHAVTCVPDPSVETLDKKLKWERKVVYFSPSRLFCIQVLYVGY